MGNTIVGAKPASPGPHSTFASIALVNEWVERKQNEHESRTSGGMLKMRRKEQNIP